MVPISAHASFPRTDPTGVEPPRQDVRRLIVASNRLPTTISVAKGQVQVQSSSGGLAAALAGLRADRPMSWIGWPGTALPRARHAAVAELLAVQQARWGIRFRSARRFRLETVRARRQVVQSSSRLLSLLAS